MIKKYLPLEVGQAISKLNISKLKEIRMRIGYPLVVDYGGLFYLSTNGITDIIAKSIICDKAMIDYVTNKACENSIYAYNDEIKQGFITVESGIRIGLAGVCVNDNTKIKTIKNLSSINIRLPHEIKNCSLNILEFITEPQIYNTLILSPPGAGKTTLLRDIAFQLSQRYIKNVLVIDERNEIANVVNGVSQYRLGVFCDIMTNCTKQFGLENGIRSMRPDVVMTDEIANKNDVDAVMYAQGCGVKVIATTHCDNLFNLRQKKDFQNIIENKSFERYVVLSTRNGAGTVEGVFDKNFKCLCM